MSSFRPALTVFIRKASGARALRVAAGDAWDSELERRAALDVVGRDRLEARRAHVRAAPRGVKSLYL